MDNEKTLRDELAISMPSETIPTVTGKPSIDAASKSLGIASFDPNASSFVEQLQWVLSYQAAVRYAYADAMLKTRAKGQ